MSTSPRAVAQIAAERADVKDQIAAAEARKTEAEAEIARLGKQSTKLANEHFFALGDDPSPDDIWLLACTGSNAAERKADEMIAAAAGGASISRAGWQIDVGRKPTGFGFEVFLDADTDHRALADRLGPIIETWRNGRATVYITVHFRSGYGLNAGIGTGKVTHYLLAKRRTWQFVEFAYSQDTVIDEGELADLSSVLRTATRHAYSDLDDDL